MTKSWIHWLCGVAALVASATAVAERFPTKAVTIIVPYATGGVTDAYGRAIGAKLSEIWGQPVVVDNRAGGGTIIGTQMASRAAPDGYTLLLTSYGFTSNPVLRTSMPYAADAFKPVLLLGKSANLLVLGPNAAMGSLDEVLKHAKSAPGAFKVASSGNASSPHIAAELFAKAVGVEITHLPYRGTGPAMNDVMGGAVDGIFDGPSAMPQVRTGRLKAIAIASETRHPAAAEVPTFRELGVDLVFGSWFGFLVPSGASQPIIEQLNADIRKALADPGVRAQIDRTGLQLDLGPPAKFETFLAVESGRLKSLIDGGAKIALD